MAGKKTNKLIIGNEILDLVDDEARDLIDTLRSDVESDIADVRSDVADDIADLRSDVNEDIADVENGIATVDARMDNLVTDINGAEVTTLWTGSLGTLNTPVTLSKSISEFDFIDIYTLNGADTTFTRVPANAGTAQIHVGNLSDDASITFLYYGEMGISLSGTSATLTKAVAFQWSPPSAPTVTDDTTIAVVTRIDGVKTSASVNAELADVRVGEDGTTYASAGAAVRTQISNVKKNLGVFNFFDGMQLGFIPTSGTTYPTTNASYPNATYVIVDLLAGQSLKIEGFASANTAGRARCIVNGSIVSSISQSTDNYTTTVNLSNSINNGTITAKKDIQIALMLLDGIVKSGTKATLDGFTSVSEMLFDTYNSTFSLTDSINSLSDEMDDAEIDIEELAEKTFDVRDIQYLVPNIPNIHYAQGYSVSAGTTSVELDVNVNYDSYWYVTDKPLTLYAVPTTGQYYAIGVLTGASGSWEEHTNYNIMRGTAGTRYRLSDNNLPTQNSPLTVPAGTLLVYTFPASNYYGAVYENQVSNILNNSVRLNDAQLAQIPNQKKVYFKYSATSGGDSSNEHIDVYTPYKEGFIHYLVVHTDSQTINADVWRISIAYITDGAFNDVTQITTSGEWECAIHLPDRNDFSGGYAHGDEVLINDPVFFKDGIPVDITDFTDITSCNEFTFVERTTMYDPSDSTRGIAEHGSAHIFNTEKLKIQQSLLWLVDTALTNTYLAMLPIAKTVSSNFYTNARHIVTAIGNTSHTESKATEAVIYGDDICCKFSVPVYSPSSAYFFETDNGGTAYNKCYFAVAATSVTHGDVWMTETDYEFK